MTNLFAAEREVRRRQMEALEWAAGARRGAAAGCPEPEWTAAEPWSRTLGGALTPNRSSS